MPKKDPPELPGYYFDKEKNRYFKLIPGQEHKNPLTGKTLRKNKFQNRIRSGKLKTNKHLSKHIVNCIPKFLSERQTFSKVNPYKNNQVIKNTLIKKIFVKNSPTNLIRGCDNLSIQRILPSKNEDKVLLQAEMSTLLQVEEYDATIGALKFSYFYEFPAEPGSCITDFSFASITSFESGILASIVPPWGGSSCLYLGPEANSYMFRKFREEYVGACKWHENYLAYSLNTKIVLVNNWERHFATASVPNESADLIKPVLSPQSQVTTLECTDAVVYAGFLNNRIIGYDKRALKSKCISINSGDAGKNVCCLKVLKNSHSILSRHGNTKDSMYLWDVRSPQKPVIEYSSLENRQNIGYRGMHKCFLTDSVEQVLSCYCIDNMLRLWEVNTGVLLAQTTELNGGVFSENFSFIKSGPGFLGLKNKSVVWLPL